MNLRTGIPLVVGGVVAFTLALLFWRAMDHGVPTKPGAVVAKWDYRVQHSGDQQGDRETFVNAKIASPVASASKDFLFRDGIVIQIRSTYADVENVRADRVVAAKIPTSLEIVAQEANGWKVEARVFPGFGFKSEEDRVRLVEGWVDLHEAGHLINFPDQKTLFFRVYGDGRIELSTPTTISPGP